MAVSGCHSPLYFLFFVVLLLRPEALMGQPDTINLPEVAVTASRLRGWQPGQEQSITDSLKLSFLKTENLSEALRSQAGVYVRDYGAGNISTAAVRGTSAGHTAVLWNGVPIRDPMLGLADLSILPLFFFDDVRLALGGGSSLWGSGALGGVIHLGSRLEEQKGFEVDYQAGAGSFGSRGQGLKLGYGKNGFTSSTRLFFRSADNDYLYKDLSGTEKRLPNAHARQMGLMQENSVELPGNHRLGIHLWAHRADRGIPPSRVQPSSRAHQEDEFLRGILDWQWAGARSSWITRVAASQNRLLYSDSLTNTFSDSRTRSLLAEAEGTHSLLPGLDAKAGVQFNYLDASSDVYSGFPRQDRWAAFAALRWESTGGRWQAVASGRQEWANGRAVPFTPSLSLHWRNRTGLQAGFAASRNYRLPTFNDLYWPNAGNPGLRPEQGWNQSLFIEAEKDWNRWEAFFRLSAFNYNVQDWIIWLPEGGLFRPENVRRVWSRGGAARLRLERELGSGAVGLEAGYSFTRSTNERSKDPGDPSVGKQLIYVPLHQGSGSLSWRSGSWYIAYRQEWAGRTYTLSDNSDWLPGFAVGALHLSREWRWKAFSGRLYARLENLWNKDYELVANRPLPGRHYQIGLNIHFSKK